MKRIGNKEPLAGPIAACTDAWDDMGCNRRPLKGEPKVGAGTASFQTENVGCVSDFCTGFGAKSARDATQGI